MPAKGSCCCPPPPEVCNDDCGLIKAWNYEFDYVCPASPALTGHHVLSQDAGSGSINRYCIWSKLISSGPPASTARLQAFWNNVGGVFVFDYWELRVSFGLSSTAFRTTGYHPCDKPTTIVLSLVGTLNCRVGGTNPVTLTKA